VADWVADWLIAGCVVMQAVDADVSLAHRQTEYHITAGDPLNNFTVDPSTGRLGVRAPLDFEKIPAEYNGSYTLTVTATDIGQPSLTDHTSVIVHINVSISLPFPLVYTIHFSACFYAFSA